MEPGDMGRVVGYDGMTDRAYRHKLLRMGLVKGAEFMLVRKAPLGDPLEIQVGEFSLTLRKDEANALKVERMTPRGCFGESELGGRRRRKRGGGSRKGS